MKSYFNVSFKYSEDVYCSNIAYSETAEAVQAYYEKEYEWVAVTPANDWDIEDAKRKGKPIIEIEEPEETAEKIIDSLKFTFEQADEQKDLITPAHVLYKCRFIATTGSVYTFKYQCNPSATHEPTKKDCLYCLLSDASCFESAFNVDDFIKEFGYDADLQSIRKGEKAYKACERTAKAIDRLFTEDEKAALNTFFENY